MHYFHLQCVDAASVLILFDSQHFASTLKPRSTATASSGQSCRSRWTCLLQNDRPHCAVKHDTVEEVPEKMCARGNPRTRG